MCFWHWLLPGHTPNSLTVFPKGHWLFGSNSYFTLLVSDWHRALLKWCLYQIFFFWSLLTFTHQLFFSVNSPLPKLPRQWAIVSFLCTGKRMVSVVYRVRCEPQYLPWIFCPFSSDKIERKPLPKDSQTREPSPRLSFNWQHNARPTAGAGLLPKGILFSSTRLTVPEPSAENKHTPCMPPRCPSLVHLESRLQQHSSWL